MSSIEALAQHARIDDLQLIKTRHSYQASKYQIDVLAPLLDERTNHVVRQFVVEPGISVTNISKKLTGTVALLIFFQYLAMYLVSSLLLTDKTRVPAVLTPSICKARFLGSKAHTIQPYIAANSAVKLSLVPLSRIKTVPEKPVKYSSTTNIWGKEQLGITPIETPSKEFGGYLLNECDSLHRTFGSETRVKQYRKDDGI
jgi:3-keto steroid reductase